MTVYATRYLGELDNGCMMVVMTLKALSDIFWTLTTGSLWNTTFKILFLASQAYVIYLMLNDYKPTHDPNIDTFKVQYLLGGSAVLAVLFPYRYEVTEVSYTQRFYKGRVNSFLKHRSCGRFQYGWSRSRSYLSCLCCSELAKPRL